MPAKVECDRQMSMCIIRLNSFSLWEVKQISTNPYLEKKMWISFLLFLQVFIVTERLLSSNSMFYIEPMWERLILLRTRALQAREFK